MDFFFYFSVDLWPGLIKAKAELGGCSCASVPGGTEAMPTPRKSRLARKELHPSGGEVGRQAAMKGFLAVLLWKRVF